MTKAFQGAAHVSLGTNTLPGGAYMTEGKKRDLKLLIVSLILLSFFIMIALFVTNLRMEQTQTININLNTEEESEKVDLNKASLEELNSLPGIGSVLSQKIIDNRPYSNIHDLKSIDGIGTKTFEKIRKLVTVGES